MQPKSLDDRLWDFAVSMITGHAEYDSVMNAMVDDKPPVTDDDIEKMAIDHVDANEQARITQVTRESNRE